ncbi:MAG: PEGA domain-containing protein [Ignavibacterium sp.]|nr:PEGA domain-containing protein [Ignavibacterium sp.]
MFLNRLRNSLSSVLILLLLLSCDKEVSVSPEEPQPFKGKLIVHSEPAGFSIFLNHKNTGSITPDSLLFMDPGNYQITLKKKYFRDTSIVIHLDIDQEVLLDVDLLNNQAMYGKLNIFSIPAGAAIYINDSLTQKVTPFTFTHLLPGEYKIKLTYPQFRSISFDVAVTSSQTSSYSKALQDTSVWVDYLVSNSGLTSNILSSIAIDDFGNKWIGSIDKGLIKFDDVEFINYNTSNSGIPSNRVLTVEVDQFNIVWVGTQNGIGRFDGTSWIVYNKNNSGLRSDEVYSVKIDPQNTLWAGTSSGLYKFDGNSWNRYNDSLLSIWANDIELDDSNIWIATNDGIVKFTDGAFQYYQQPDYNYPSIIVSSTAKDMIGNIWFCHKNYKTSRNGISYFNGTQFVNFYPGSNLNSMNHISVDMFNNKWISTNEGLVKLSSNNNMLIYNRSNSLISSDIVSSSAIDKNGILWITNAFNGLNKFKFNTN